MSSKYQHYYLGSSHPEFYLDLENGFQKKEVILLILEKMLGFYIFITIFVFLSQIFVRSIPSFYHSPWGQSVLLRVQQTASSSRFSQQKGFPPHFFRLRQFVYRTHFRTSVCMFWIWTHSSFFLFPLTLIFVSSVT